MCGKTYVLNKPSGKICGKKYGKIYGSNKHMVKYMVKHVVKYAVWNKPYGLKCSILYGLKINTYIKPYENMA